MRRSRSWQLTALLLLVLALVSACKHPVAAPPPPPPTTSAGPGNVVPAVTRAAPPTITLRADSSTVARGSAITLTWNATNATTVDVQPGIGAVAVQGSRQVSPASSVTYTATATGPGGTAADTLRITVNDPPPPATNAPRGNGGGTVVQPTGPSLSMTQLFDRNMQPINFDYDKSDIRDDQKSKIQTAATFLKGNPTIRLTVEGHCDERGSEEYNLALGDRRANAVKKALAELGIAENRVVTVSYGEERPVCSDKTEECYAKNRRAAFTLNP